MGVRPAASWEEEARLVLPADVYEYVRQGSHASTSAEEAVAAWESWRLVPRVLRDVREVSTRTSLLGHAVEAPLGVAPTTLQRAAHPDAEVATATACAGAGVPLVLSSNATASFAEVAATGVRWWLQVYVTEDRSLVEPVLDAAVEAGASALVLTVDTPVVARKNDGGSDSVLGRVPPGWVRPHLGPAADAPKARDLGPGDVRWLGSRTGLPVVLKGVLHPDDARGAVHAGAAAVWVSNHGGRQLDRTVPTAAVLAEVAAAVGGAAQVYVDGGVRDHLSILTALALGADGVFLGRQPYYALAVGGAVGVSELLGDLVSGLAEALRLAGCRDVTEAAQLRAMLARRPSLSFDPGGQNNL